MFFFFFPLENNRSKVENKAKLPSREYDSLNSFNHCKFIIIYMFCFIHSDSACAFRHPTALHTIGNSLPSLSLSLSRAWILIDQLCLTSLLCDLVLKVRILSSVQISISVICYLYVFLTLPFRCLVVWIWFSVNLKCLFNFIMHLLNNSFN